MPHEVPAQAPSPSSHRFRWIWTKLIGPPLATLLVFAFFCIADAVKNGDEAKFSSPRNLKTIASQSAPVVTAALGMTMIIISGGIDLSVGTTLALAATVLADHLARGGSPVVGIGLCIATGCLVGVWNGTLISLLKIPPFIVTLGTMTMALGLGNLLAKETTVRPTFQQIPVWLDRFLSPLSPVWLGLPAGVWLALFLSLLLGFVLQYTVFGRHLYAIGSNEATARLCGINVTFTKIAIYVLAGLFTGLAGVCQFARLTIGSPATGSGQELRIIAAVIVGGASLEGGRGTVLGTISGALIMTMMSTGCTLLNIKNPMQDILVGVIIILAVTVDHLRRR